VRLLLVIHAHTREATRDGRRPGYAGPNETGFRIKEHYGIHYDKIDRRNTVRCRGVMVDPPCNPIQITRFSEPQLAGRPGRKWWRVRYWIAGETRARSKYIASAEGRKAVTHEEAKSLILVVLRDVVDDAIDRLTVDAPAPSQTATVATADAPGAQSAVPTLDEVITSYMQRGSQRYSKNTIKTLGETTRYMRAFFGPSTPIDQITPHDADRWFDAMVTGEFAKQLERFEGRPNNCQSSGLSDGTIKPEFARRLELRGRG